jgi:hypothetical protein
VGSGGAGEEVSMRLGLAGTGQRDHLDRIADPEGFRGADRLSDVACGEMSVVLFYHAG